MDDTDDGSSQGLSGWAGYALGRMAEASAQRDREFFASCFARPQQQPEVFDANEVREVIDGWKKAVKFHEDRIENIKADRAAVRLERDELREHNKVYREESLAQLAYIRELTESREAALQGERLARVREDLQRIYVAELLEEIAKLKAKG